MSENTFRHLPDTEAGIRVTARGENGAQRRPEHAGGAKHHLSLTDALTPPWRTRAGKFRRHRRGLIPMEVRVVMQKAPDLQGGVIRTAFCTFITLWLLGGPLDDASLHLSMLLPALAGYEIGAQCADTVPQGRE